MYRHYRPALTHEQTKKVDITCYMVDIPPDETPLVLFPITRLNIPLEM